MNLKILTAWRHLEHSPDVEALEAASPQPRHTQVGNRAKSESEFHVASARLMHRVVGESEPDKRSIEDKWPISQRVTKCLCAHEQRVQDARLTGRVGTDE